MIKKKTKKVVSSIVLPDDIEQKIALIVNPELAVKKADLDRATSRIADLKRSLTSYESSVKKLGEDIVQEIDKQTSLKGELKTIDTSGDAEKVANQIKALKKIAGVSEVTIREDGFYFELLPIFTDVRVGDGERKKVRRCIGAFSCKVYFSPSRPKVKQLSFNTGNIGHWSVAHDDGACLGGWESVFYQLASDRDIAGYILTMIEYLKSTDDGGAYCRSHDWVQGKRDNNIREIAGKFDFAVGDTIVLLEDDCWSRGVRGIIKEFHPEHPSLYCRLEGIKHSTGTMGTINNYWIKLGNLAKTSKVDYKRPVMMASLGYVKSKRKTIGGKTREEIVEAIDKAPDGITKEELNKLMI